MAAAAPARFLTVDDEFDALDSFDAEVLPGAKLREGMVLVDPELGTPLLLLDHRTPPRAAVGSCSTARPAATSSGRSTPATPATRPHSAGAGDTVGDVRAGASARRPSGHAAG